MWSSAGGHFHSFCLFSGASGPPHAELQVTLAPTGAVLQDHPCLLCWSLEPGVDLLPWAMGPLQGVHWATAGGCVRPPRGDTLPFLPGTPGGAYWTLPPTPSLQGTLHPSCWDTPRLLQSPSAPFQSPLCITGEKTEVQTSGADSDLRE